MTDITFVTGNALKYTMAAHACQKAGITLLQKDVAIDEIQGEDSVRIARQKCQDAYDAIGSPVLINDDSWSVPALGGFPGPYMKSINQWLSADDWLALTRRLTDRTIVLTQYTVYQDERGQQLFTNTVTGQLLPEARGANEKHPFQAVVSLDGDDGLSIAQALTRNPDHFNTRNSSKVYEDFVAWFTDTHKATS